MKTDECWRVKDFTPCARDPKTGKMRAFGWLGRKLFNDFLKFESDELSQSAHHELWLRTRPQHVLTEEEFKLWR